MVLFMMVIGSMMKKMVMEYISLVMVIYMKVNLKIIKNKVKVNIYLKMVQK